MDSVTLADLRARRAALDEEIRVVEARDRENWNEALDYVVSVLDDWLREHKIEYSQIERKNEETWDVGHGALTVTFGFDDGEHSRSVRMVSGKTLNLEWSEAPKPERLLAIVAVLLGKSQ
jgi:hypothetical protein